MFFASNVRRVALALAIAGMSVAAPFPVAAELAGADRLAFVKNFISGCLSSSGSERLIAGLGGSPSDLEQYCTCVANAYADRLSLETADKLREIERLALADFARNACLAERFPDREREEPKTQFLPLDLDIDSLKLIFGRPPELHVPLQIDGPGPDRAVQVMVVELPKNLFCWAEPLAVEPDILGSAPEAPVISALWCHERTGGYVEMFRIAEEEFIVGFALEDGMSGWFSHEIEF